MHDQNKISELERNHFLIISEQFFTLIDMLERTANLLDHELFGEIIGGRLAKAFEFADADREYILSKIESPRELQDIGALIADERIRGGASKVLAETLLKQISSHIREHFIIPNRLLDRDCSTVNELQMLLRKYDMAIQSMINNTNYILAITFPPVPVLKDEDGKIYRITFTPQLTVSPLLTAIQEMERIGKDASINIKDLFKSLQESERQRKARKHEAVESSKKIQAETRMEEFRDRIQRRAESSQKQVAGLNLLINICAIIVAGLVGWATSNATEKLSAASEISELTSRLVNRDKVIDDMKKKFTSFQVENFELKKQLDAAEKRLKNPEK